MTLNPQFHELYVASDLNDKANRRLFFALVM